MRLVFISCLILICACTSVAKRNPADVVLPSLSEPEIESYAQKAVLILRPRLFRLDRPAITFYYEEMPAHEKIDTLEEVNAHLLQKPDRFSGQQIGLYSEADPKGSRSFGKERPRLFVLQIREGTLFYNDLHPTEMERRQFIESLHLNQNAFQDLSAIHYIGNMNADDNSRFKIEKRVIELLGTNNRLYHFNEAALLNCRYNGTDIALELHDSESFEAVALYSDTEFIESTQMAGEIKRLFDEVSFLNGDKSAPLPGRIRRGAKALAGNTDYRRWKNRFILTCGSRWAFE